MNRERVIELAGHAGFGKQITNGEPHIWGGEMETRKMEKFTQMVVKQCIFEMVHESTFTSNKQVQDFTVNVTERIKKRFGIE